MDKSQINVVFKSWKRDDYKLRHAKTQHPLDTIRVFSQSVVGTREGWSVIDEGRRGGVGQHLWFYRDLQQFTEDNSWFSEGDNS